MAAIAASRPTVSIYAPDDAATVVRTSPLPDVFTVPIRPDVINFVHTQMAKNKRQAYAVKFESGMQHSAESWGTGRAVSRIPRISGGGTHRASQGAFGNMCRSGRMFAPTKVWRRWHRRIAKGQRRYAVTSALAASAVPALVMARGHRINDVPEIPLVLDNKLSDVVKTKQALALLGRLGLTPELDKVKDTKKIRAGKGKARNRRYILKKGPLVVHDAAKDSTLLRAMRNIPGVELASVDNLSLLSLAPGGHVGRLIIWTSDAFEKLNTIFGTRDTPSLVKKGFSLPRGLVVNADLARLVNSDEVQKVVRPTKEAEKKLKKRNPLKKMSVMEKLNPYDLVLRRQRLRNQQADMEEKRKAKRDAAKKLRREEGTARPARTAFYEKMME